MARVLAVVALVAALATSAVACAAGAGGGLGGGVTRVPTSRENQLAADLVARVNAERAARGLNRLAPDPDLALRAFRWSETMVDSGFHHSDLHALLARFVAVAENIGKGGTGTTAGTMHVAWMHSDGHRHDVLAPNLDRIGVGVFCGPDGTMWATEQFGSLRSPDFGSLPPLNPIARPDAGSLTC